MTTDAIEHARRGLIRAGFGAPLRAAAVAAWGGLGTPEEQRALLTEVADYIGDRDPTMIGAAWLLEQEGYERSQLTLSLGDMS
jgi:hypothetical protein